jgi:hypothetical protein
MHIVQGLIIADPWIGYILDGSKTWEMRSSPTQVRGAFALIRKGTGAVSGVATLAGVGWALTPAQMLETCHLHQIPAEMIRSGEVAKWNTPLDTHKCQTAGNAGALQSPERRRYLGQSR